MLLYSFGWSVGLKSQCQYQSLYQSLNIYNNYIILIYHFHTYSIHSMFNTVVNIYSIQSLKPVVWTWRQHIQAFGWTASRPNRLCSDSHQRFVARVFGCTAHDCWWWLAGDGMSCFSRCLWQHRSSGLPTLELVVMLGWWCSERTVTAPAYGRQLSCIFIDGRQGWYNPFHHLTLVVSPNSANQPAR